MKKQISNARASITPLFLDIIKENHREIIKRDSQVQKLKKELAKAIGEDNIILLERKISSAEDKLSNASIIVVVFTAMSLEAYIYDYAARHLGDSYVKDHLDKLDTSSKWTVIPELVTGNNLPNRHEWYPPLKNLIKIRNSIIHHKSSEPLFPLTQSDIKLYLQKQMGASRLIYETARQSISLLGILADKISEIDPEETPWVKSHLT